MSAVLQDRRSLRQVAAALSEPQGGWPNWVPAEHAGTLNRVYAGQGVWRGYLLVQRRSSWIPGVCFARECRILGQIRRHSWAPGLLAADPGASLLLFPRYAGVMPAMPRPAAILGVLADLQRLRAVPRLDYDRLWRAYAARLVGSAGGLSACGQLARALRKLPESAACLVHHDLHPGNVLHAADDARPQSFKIIDWEYAGLGSPWLDMAAVRTHWGFAASDFARLPAAAGLSVAAIGKALGTAAAINEMLANLWLALITAMDID